MYSVRVSLTGRFLKRQPLWARFSSTSTSPREYKVILDNQTIYIEKPLAEALGWTSECGTEGVKLSLHGWHPKYFVITPAGSESERLARGTVESGQNPNVHKVLDLLKAYDASE